MLRALRVLTVGVDRASGDPVTIMGEVGGSYRLMPIRLDLPGATLLEDERRGSPATATGLLGQIVASFDRGLEYVEITDADDGTFRAELVFDAGARVGAPLGDAIAVALSLDVVVMVENGVLDRTAATPGEGLDVDNGLETAGVQAVDDAARLECFRRFLDTATPADFAPATPSA